MSPYVYLLPACTALAGLAIGWVLAGAGRARSPAAGGETARRAAAFDAAAEAFETALLLVDDGRPSLIGGREALAACARALAVGDGGQAVDPQAVIDALSATKPDHGRRLNRLFTLGEACAFEGRGLKGAVWLEGRAAGTLVWLRLGVAPARPTDSPAAARRAALALARHAAAHELLLDQIGDAVAVFGPDQRLIFHNRAFAALWDLEPAWLGDGPSHGEILDRLRQRRRLPELVDYGRFKAGELARHGEIEPSAEAIWRLPSDRTLRVLGQPHPAGGLTLLFRDMTHELRLRTQFNHLIEVQRATLDKLTDAVAVFGSDARLKLHNEAFERFWGLTAEQLARTPDFDGVVELCLPRLHDRQFWRQLKWRITDPDPSVRAPAAGEVTMAERRVVAYQSRPLPDGATLIGFSDLTDARRLKSALADREAALIDAERLKREFVASVSHELRTPLTTV
ncbi:MAG: PAS-domain containing protein, partial [Caulobacteraceae bacterium]